MKHYVEGGYHLTIETNGSIDIDLKEEWQKKLLFSMSVKLSNSLEPLKKRVNKETLTKILTNTKIQNFQFIPFFY